jgi:flagellar motor switch protein FliM
MADNDLTDEDLSGAWEQALAESGGKPTSPVAVEAAEEERRNAQLAADLSAERTLQQDEIDQLLGFSLDDNAIATQNGIRALVDSTLVSYERKPMIEIIFDRLVRLLTTSLRNFFSDNVEVSIASLRSMRFGDYLTSIPLPTVLAVFKAQQWDNFGLVTLNSDLMYAVIDVLLGGRRGRSNVRAEGRPYTTIEINLVRRMVDVVLADTEQAFAPISRVDLAIDRMETNPRFASISRPANAAILVNLRVEMDGRGGNVEILLPYATIEPIRDLLLQSFMGEKFGRDPIWEDHLATEIWQARSDVDAILYETQLPLHKMLELKVGDTLMFDIEPDSPIKLKCGDVLLTEARMGRVGDKIAVRVMRPLKRSRTTFAAYEASAAAPREK